MASQLKGLALTAIGTPLELDPFSETNYVAFPSVIIENDEKHLQTEVCVTVGVKTKLNYSGGRKLFACRGRMSSCGTPFRTTVW